MGPVERTLYILASASLVFLLKWVESLCLVASGPYDVESWLDVLRIRVALVFASNPGFYAGDCSVWLMIIADIIIYTVCLCDWVLGDCFSGDFLQCFNVS